MMLGTYVAFTVFFAAQGPITELPGTPVTLGGSPAAAAPQGAAPRVDTAEIARLRVSIDSLRSANSALRFKVPLDSASRRSYEHTVGLAKLFLLIWFGIVLGYLAWAVHRYVYNYGLSNREWKTLYPEVYVTWLDRLITKIVGSDSFETRRAKLLEFKMKANARDAEPVGTTVFDEPTKNPYESDSFGLPPGTIRGILALTALVMFLLVELVNLASPASLEGQFDGLITAFQMVLAFYFGSRAVEVLQAKSAAKAAEATAAQEPATVATTAVTTTVTAAKAAAEPALAKDRPEGLVEKSVLPESATNPRFASLVSLAKTALPSPIVTKAAATARALTVDTPLATRVLALTAAFETGRAFPECFGGVAGNFDGQGISFGALQWNIGQGSLQPLWKEMRDNNLQALKELIGEELYPAFSRMLDGTKEEQMRWALDIQFVVSGRTNAWRLSEPWNTVLHALGMHRAMIDIQVAHAAAFYGVALGFCREYGLRTERGVALMFDVRVQNGSPDRAGSGERIRTDFELINPTLSADEQEVERLRIIARQRAAVSRPAFQNDVLQRKLTIANGSGVVHGRSFDLEKEFSIGLRPLAGAPAKAGAIA